MSGVADLSLPRVHTTSVTCPIASTSEKFTGETLRFPCLWGLSPCSFK